MAAESFVDCDPHCRDAQRFRASYDAIAPDYADRIYGELKDKPFDRAILDRFANRVRHRGLLCDLGCGPAQIARYLRDANCRVLGFDLSHGMLLEARRLNPDIGLIEGSMLTLPFASGSVAGIAAFYSIIHLRRDQVAKAFDETHRVLRPWGCALVAFHLGAEDEHVSELWGHAVDLDVTFLSLTEVSEHLKAAGFRIAEALERDPYHPDVEYQSRRGYILAIKDT